MASIVKTLNKKTGVTYVYESESYWDKEKKQPRSKRKLIGRIDEETGEIIPTSGKKGRRKEAADIAQTACAGGSLESAYTELSEELKQKDTEITALKKQVMELTLSVNDYKRRLSKIEDLSHL